MNKENKTGGFTLIEIAIAITIVSLLVIPAMKMYEAWQNQSRMAASQQRLDAIQQALANFMTQYGRLPCPSSFIARPGEANYEREVVSLCTKTDGTLYTPDGQATFAATGRSTPVQVPPINPAIIIGAVPVRDLGLPESTRADAYGHLFTYAVSAVDTIALLGGAGVIDVVDATGQSMLPYASDRTSTGTALYVLVDHGKDGKGAYADNPGPAAAMPAVPCNSAPGMDTLNCSFELQNPASPFAFRSAPFGNQPGANWFDDTVVFYTILSPVIPVAAKPGITNLPQLNNLPQSAQPAQSDAGAEQQLNNFIQQGGLDNLRKQLNDLQQNMPQQNEQ